MAVLLLADRRLQRYRLLRNLQNLPYLIHRHIHLCGNFVRRGIVAQLLKELPADADDLIDRLYHVYGNANRPRLIGNGPGNSLPNPPCCIGGELVALCIIKLLNSLDKAQIALLNQIKEQHSAAHIPLCD